MGGRSAVPVAPDPPAAGADAAQLRAQVQQLRQELEEHRRVNAILSDAVEQFTGALAHDLKNPLAAIKVSVQGLKRALGRKATMNPEQLGDRLSRIESAVDQAQEHISAVRARLGSETALRTPLRRDTVDLVAIVRETVNGYRRIAGPRRVHLECALTVLPGCWDEQRVRQVLEALLDNALKFSPDNQPVTVTVERDATGGLAVVRCRDRGIGIPARDVPHLCERLYRAENVLGRYKGAGMGLFEAHTSIAQHGGELQIESEEGSGSLFTVVLPVTEGSWPDICVHPTHVLPPPNVLSKSGTRKR